MDDISAIKYLEENGIPFKVKTFPEDTEKGTLTIAKVLGVKPEIVVKTLIMKGHSGKLYLCLIGGESKLHYKKFKKIIEEEDMTMASPSEIHEQTGYEIGAIPPFALKNRIDVYIDDSLRENDELYVGAGRFGYEIMISPDNLQKATDGKFVDIIKNISE
ncbi:aminoacyl-tRNA deacylase [Candidatus Aenigmatarchaeota archaeon]